MPLTIAQVIDASYKTAMEKGWWDQPRTIPELIALMHSELSEALEDYRTQEMLAVIDPSGKPIGLPVELADVIIRIADMCGYFNIPLEKALEMKLKYNTTRPYRHGGKLL